MYLYTFAFSFAFYTRSCMTLVRNYFICAVLRSCETRAELVVCGRSRCHAWRSSVAIYLCGLVCGLAILWSCFRDTANRLVFTFTGAMVKTIILGYD